LKKFKVGQTINLPTAFRGKYKRVHYPESEQDQVEVFKFDIIGKNDSYSEYLILLDPDMLGYSISDFHILHSEVDEKHKGSKFWYVSEYTLNQYN
jgi:hypothetical protein